MTLPATSSNMHFSVDAGVASLELRRSSKRNAVTSEMWESMIESITTASIDPNIRLLAVRGSDGVFSAGADLTEVKDSSGEASRSFHELAVRALTALSEFPAPSVALIDGPCIGGGCSIAVACDLRFATPTALFGVPAVRHGIKYDAPSLTRLVQLMGVSAATRFMVTADRIDGAHAAALGLVDECTDDLDASLADLASKVVLGQSETINWTKQEMRFISNGQGGRPHA